MQKCDDNMVHKIWNWCSDIYSQHGISLRLPNNTKPQNTYQWRYCRSLANKFLEWELDEETAKYFIHTAVKYSKQLGTLRKGLAALHQKNMLETVYKLILKDQDNNKQYISSIFSINKWLNNQIGHNNPSEILLYREDEFSFPNIIIWYQAGKISKLYLALSKSCYNAINKLQYPERDQLPSISELYKLRTNFVKDPKNLQKTRTILDKDWRNCVN